LLAFGSDNNEPKLENTIVRDKNINDTVIKELVTLLCGRLPLSTTAKRGRRDFYV
jgi:hypothetical protein